MNINDLGKKDLLKRISRIIDDSSFFTSSANIEEMPASQHARVLEKITVDVVMISFPKPNETILLLDDIEEMLSNNGIECVSSDYNEKTNQFIIVIVK